MEFFVREVLLDERRVLGRSDFSEVLSLLPQSASVLASKSEGRIEQSSMRPANAVLNSVEPPFPGYAGIQAGDSTGKGLNPGANWTKDVNRKRSGPAPPSHKPINRVWRIRKPCYFPRSTRRPANSKTCVKQTQTRRASRLILLCALSSARGISKTQDHPSLTPAIAGVKHGEKETGGYPPGDADNASCW